MRYAINAAAINDSRRIYGYGVAAIQLNATGFSSRQKYGVSTAAVTELFAAGAMRQAKAGIGSVVLIDLQAAGALKQAVPGVSTAALTSLSARYGIPHPKYIPGGVTVTHPSREIRIPADGRVVDISGEGES